MRKEHYQSGKIISVIIMNSKLNLYSENWPNKNEYNQNLNLTLLKKQLAGHDVIGYSYVIRTIRYQNQHFKQIGCGPNFQGGLVTLCTCKHQMRTWRDTKDWRGIWIIGVSNLTEINLDKNYLIYMMKVKESYNSFEDLWNNLPNNTKKIKNTRANKFGDVYQPREDIDNPYKPDNYFKSIGTHCHNTEKSIIYDICYFDNKRRPAMLVGDPKLTFIWLKPIISLKHKHVRGNPLYKNKNKFFEILNIGD